MIPIYEENEVRVESGYNIHEWRLLTWQERAIEVARYRISKAIEYQVNLAEERYAERRARK